MTQQTLDSFQAIADPSRRQILRMLSKKSLTINALAENFDMSRPAVSKHIKVLELNGFIAINEIGRERHCTLKKDGFAELQQWLNYFDSFWKLKLDKLGALLEERKKMK